MSAFDVEYTYNRGFDAGIESLLKTRKAMFVRGAVALRRYTDFENSLDNLGVDLMCSAVSNLAEEMLHQLWGNDVEWSYDPVADFDWVATWCSAPMGQTIFSRKNQAVKLVGAVDLFEFVMEMRKLDWPDELPDRWKGE